MNDDTHPPRLSDALAELDYGLFDQSAGADFQALLQAVQERDRKGAMTVTLTVTPIRVGQVDIRLSNKVALPKGAEPSQVVWIDAEGRLSDGDPNQQRINFDPDTGEILQ